MIRGLIVFIITSSLIACAPKDSDETASGGRKGPTYPGPAETEYCSTSKTFADPITVSGTAVYNRRVIWGNLTAGGLGSASTTASSHPASQNPIRRAEIRVTDPSGAVVQCAETDGSGAFSFTLPRGAVSYTISVNSRSYNQYLRASVLNAPERNQFYSLKTTCTATGACSVGTLIAGADGELLGGAFNILDQLHHANDYLRSKVSTCNSLYNGCRDVTTTNPVPKVVAYWEKGFNPNSYFGGTSGLSFYLPGYSRLFILGGQDGDVNNSDTDHFDNPVIIHEYGHFLEDVVGRSDSPGGSHNGNKVIDPRLAWSEGWGNFFQATVIAYYDPSGPTVGRYVDSVAR
ncbi:MAG: hypothetical protein HC902_05330 [Calothrix sp. SM1_5_4]|nr:hypothetical protein [Calothrix sp. SM1_5_4]